MIATTVARPTENAAIGRVKPRALAALSRLQELLAYAIRVHDHCAANLLRRRPRPRRRTGRCLMVIARIPADTRDAELRTIAAAHQADAAGYEHVHTGYDPTHATYTVNADQPGQHARNVVDAYLGR